MRTARHPIRSAFIAIARCVLLGRSQLAAEAVDLRALPARGHRGRASGDGRRRGLHEPDACWPGTSCSTADRSPAISARRRGGSAKALPRGCPGSAARALPAGQRHRDRRPEGVGLERLCRGAQRRAAGHDPDRGRRARDGARVADPQGALARAGHLPGSGAGLGSLRSRRCRRWWSKALMAALGPVPMHEVPSPAISPRPRLSWAARWSWMPLQRRHGIARREPASY